MSKEESKTLYAVNIMRTDSQHITAFESEKYDSCYEKWEELSKKWEEASKNQTPFRLTEPVVTTFHPALIKEITLVPVVEQQQSKHANPYQKEMVENGFSSTINKYRSTTGVEAVHPYLTDQGYK